MTPSVASLQAFFAEEFSAFVERHYPEDQPLAAACSYALQGKGKWVRPLLVFLSAQACGGRKEAALSGAIAIEMLHTYSLVHDDLPSFDNDSLRRGRPTVHVKFDEPTALLVGDALLTDAWALLSGGLDPELSAGLRAEQRLKQIHCLAQACGSQGMVLGQMLDMLWTGKEQYQQADLIRIHQLKTGALLGAACMVGGLAAEATPLQLVALELVGKKTGLAFQIIDDLLDELDNTGKSKGKDKAQGKLTYLKNTSRDEASKMALRLTREALEAVKHLPEPAVLENYIASLLQRQF